jgi:predicted ferric reductase
MIGAGTGILPFIDILDLIFKKQIAESLAANGQDASMVQPAQDYASLFPGARFKLLSAFATIEDFNGWDFIDKLAELSKKSGNGLFEAIVRIKGGVLFNGIQKYEKYFNKDFYAKHITSKTEKIWVCGPPVMQAAIFKDLVANGVPMDKIYYV